MHRLRVSSHLFPIAPSLAQPVEWYQNSWLRASALHGFFMRKHGTITACAGVGRLPPIPNRRERARAAKPSERRPPFWKARSHRQEPQVPQGQPGHQGFQVYRESQALIFRGGHARNRVIFINSGREHGKRGPPPESLGITDLALCLRVARGRQMRGPGGP